MTSNFHRAEGACEQKLNEAETKIKMETKGFLVVQCPCCHEGRLRTYWRVEGAAKIARDSETVVFPEGFGVLWCPACKQYTVFRGLTPFWWPRSDPLQALRTQVNVQEVDDYDASWKLIADAIPWKDAPDR